MDKIRSLPSKEISSIVQPTFGAFIPLLASNAEAIFAHRPKTHAYGPHPRQTLDIFTSTSHSPNSPLLIFLHGGGLTRGDKQLPPSKLGPTASPLVYSNLGSFFANAGYTTIIPNYRRVNDPAAGTGEDAVFPSGGEDVSLVLQWLGSTASGLDGNREVFVMGNSAGGVHLSTFLLHPQFLDVRRSMSASQDGGLTLKGAVMLSVPCDFDGALDSRKEMMATYWPVTLAPTSTTAQAEGNSTSELQPRSLLKSLGSSGKSSNELGIPPVLMAEGELDPEDEILDGMARMKSVWSEVFDGEGLETLVMKGHNHISPALALMSGDEEAEAWGRDVLRWFGKVVSNS